MGASWEIERMAVKDQAQLPRRCMFCLTGKLSREHMWSQWTHDLLPTSTAHALVNSQGWHDEPEWKSKKIDRQGSVTNVRLKVVCTDCNSGWMNRLEDAVRHHLPDVIQIRPMVLTANIRLSLLRWITLKLMVQDKASKLHSVFTPNEHRAFHEDRTIPENLNVWLTHCVDKTWSTVMWSHAIGAGNSLTERPEHLPNIKLWTWGLGDLLVVAFYRRDVELPLGLGPATMAKRIWPDPSSAPIWPPEESIDGPTARKIATSLDRLDEHKEFVQVRGVAPDIRRNR